MLNMLCILLHSNTSPKFLNLYFQLVWKTVYIRDPDKMASERNQLIKI